jgi:hypothetical protein
MPGPMVLDARWRNFMRDAFYFRLLRMIYRDRSISPSWRTTLRNAAVLIGQSIGSSDVPMSFLQNMIALEMLLTRQGDKYSDVLPKRIEAFLGWVGFWRDHDYENRIRELYRKRCDLVHRGERDTIAANDLLFSDNLLFNLLVNITAFPRLFPSKDSIIEFSELVEAEHRLGVRPRVRPKQLSFYSLRYTDGDIGEI